jgi:hypothetical protein
MGTRSEKEMRLVEKNGKWQVGFVLLRILFLGLGFLQHSKSLEYNHKVESTRDS